MIYAGIGSRATPRHIIDLMILWGRYAATQGWSCATGAAKGADQAFATGALQADGQLYLHLPWATYESKWIKTLHGRVYTQVYDRERDVAAIQSVNKYHPNPGALKHSVFALHARNYNILEHAHHVVCWTPGGAVSGGTGQGIRIANDLNKEVYNLGNPDTEKAFRQRLGP